MYNIIFSGDSFLVALTVKTKELRFNTSILKISSLLVNVRVKIMRFWMFIICCDWPVIKPVTIMLSSVLVNK